MKKKEKMVVFSLRATESELVEWREAAAKLGAELGYPVSVAKWIRHACKQKAPRIGPGVFIGTAGEDLDAGFVSLDPKTGLVMNIKETK